MPAMEEVYPLCHSAAVNTSTVAGLKHYLGHLDLKKQKNDLFRREPFMYFQLVNECTDAAVNDIENQHSKQASQDADCISFATDDKSDEEQHPLGYDLKKIFTNSRITWKKLIQSFGIAFSRRIPIDSIRLVVTSSKGELRYMMYLPHWEDRMLKKAGVQNGDLIVVENMDGSDCPSTIAIGPDLL